MCLSPGELQRRLACKRGQLYINSLRRIRMRKLIAAEFLTLDGVIEASEEWQPFYVSEDVAEEI